MVARSSRGSPRHHAVAASKRAIVCSGSPWPWFLVGVAPEPAKLPQVDDEVLGGM